MDEGLVQQRNGTWTPIPSRPGGMRPGFYELFSLAIGGITAGVRNALWL